MADTSKLSNVLKAKEDMAKSPEQLEAEKREIINQRMVPLELNGKNKDGLVEIVQQFHEILIKLYSQIYDMTEKQERQKYDMMELSERARQIEKGKAKTRKSNIVHTGLGGSVFQKTAENFPQAPGKISLFSRYERVTDRRTFGDRRTVFMVPKGADNYVPHKSKAKIPTAEAPKGNKNLKSRRQKLEEEAKKELEQTEEQPQEEQPQEEEHHEEENHEEEAQHEEEEHHEEEEQQEEEANEDEE
jgi:hypothetical protein